MVKLNEVLQEITKLQKPRQGTKLLAVSKLQSIENILRLYDQGQRLFGENYVQEAMPKIATLEGRSIEWHFIGSLQRNKVKWVVGAFALIHSVDSIELLKKIDEEAAKKDIRQDILLSVNLANEATKSGFSVVQIREVIPQLGTFPNIRMRGLMTMPPPFDDAELTRPYFRQLRELCDWAQKNFPEKSREPSAASLELSMGTSHDYQIAVGEGSTIVRIGTALFGERKKV